MVISVMEGLMRALHGAHCCAALLCSAPIRYPCGSVEPWRGFSAPSNFAKQKSPAYPGLFMTQPAATLPDPESTTFHSVAHPHRTVEYVSGALGRETPYLRGLETSRDGRVMNNPGLWKHLIVVHSVTEGLMRALHGSHVCDALLGSAPIRYPCGSVEPWRGFSAPSNFAKQKSPA
mgnify:CR=1 FL=1